MTRDSEISVGEVRWVNSGFASDIRWDQAVNFVVNAGGGNGAIGDG